MNNRDHSPTPIEIFFKEHMKSKKDNPYKAILTQLILDTLEKSGKTALNYKQVAAELNITDNDSKSIISDILQEQCNLGRIHQPRRGKFLLRNLAAYVKGKVDMTADGSAYIIPFEEEALEGDIYIAPRKLRQALHGDEVRVHIYERRRGKKLEGEVVEVIKRAKTQFTGTMQISGKLAFFLADDRKMIHDIFIPIDSLKGAKDGEKVIVSLTNWPKNSKNPIGKVSEILGKKGENNAEMNAILADFGFPLSFPKEVMQQAKSYTKQLDPKEIKRRKDFRNTLTFTIDPADAKDFDDAISFKILENGNYEIGVHIADVTHYVRPESPIDLEALERGTSVYLVDRVIPMLPEELSNDLCSLNPNEDKLSFSAVFEMNHNGTVVSQWFGKTVIRSKYRLSYEEAQESIENKTGPLSQEINTLNNIALKLRRKRFKNGAISFESEEVQFKLDEKGKPLGVFTRERKEAHMLIEDFMLLANRSVAEFIGKKGRGKNKPGFIYRFHDEPEIDNLNSFAQFAARFGHKLNLKNGKETARSINTMMERIEGQREQNLLSTLAIRSMAKAIYTTKQHSHYGLAFNYYTHFTSPIRRYPDLLVHRLLEHYLEGGKNINEEFYEKLCEHASQMEKRAADAERASIKYKQAEFLQDQIGKTFSGIISGVTEWGMYVEIQENKCEGMVRLRDITDDFYVLDEKNYAIIGEHKKKSYQLGDEVRIKVKKVDLDKRQIDFTLIS